MVCPSTVCSDVVFVSAEVSLLVFRSFNTLGSVANVNPASNVCGRAFVFDFDSLDCCSLDRGSIEPPPGSSRISSRYSFSQDGGASGSGVEKDTPACLHLTPPLRYRKCSHSGEILISKSGGQRLEDWGQPGEYPREPQPACARHSGMAAPSGGGNGDGGSGSGMDATLWGELQNFFDLSLIYAKLPLAPFFRLRQVCKEWNRLASDRGFLLQNFKAPISDVYFFLPRGRTGRLLMLSGGFSRSWGDTRLPPFLCEASGLFLEDSCNRVRVFDVHTRVVHYLEAPPIPLDEATQGYLGFMGFMTADTTQTPYRFCILISHGLDETVLYDSTSGVWSEMKGVRWIDMLYSTLPCVHYENVLYILHNVDGYFALHTCDLKRDEWDMKYIDVPEVLYDMRVCGAWQDQWFAIGLDEEERLPIVWETKTRFEDPWIPFDVMPRALNEWLKELSVGDSLDICFCGEHVLFSTFKEKVEERAVLLNLDRKTWEKVELPTTREPSCMEKRVRETRPMKCAQIGP